MSGAWTSTRSSSRTHGVDPNGASTQCHGSFPRHSFPISLLLVHTGLSRRLSSASFARAVCVGSMTSIFAGARFCSLSTLHPFGSDPDPSKGRKGSASPSVRGERSDGMDGPCVDSGHGRSLDGPSGVQDARAPNHFVAIRASCFCSCVMDGRGFAVRGMRNLHGEEGQTNERHGCTYSTSESITCRSVPDEEGRLKQKCERVRRKFRQCPGR